MSDSGSDAAGANSPDATGGSETNENERNGSAIPEISARLYEMEVTVSGGDGDTLAEVGDRFDETWSRVLETYREEREADDTRPFQ